MCITKKISKDDTGSALALVLFFIVLLSLWLGSVSLLTQSSSSAIRQNLSQNELRSQYVGYGFNAALSALTPYPGTSCQGAIDDKSNPCRRGTLANPCNNSNFASAFNSALAQIFPTNVNKDLQLINNLKVVCDQAPNSGIYTSLPSLVLIGDGSDCNNPNSSPCEIGKHGGLRISASGASDSSTPLCSSIEGASSRYVSYGSVFNRSGKWQDVDCSDFEIKNIPLEMSYIYQPTSNLDAYCPSNWTPCNPLDNWGGKYNNIGKIKNLSYNNFATKVNAFISYTAKQLDTFPTSRATFNPPTLICSNVTSQNYIEISPGLISNSPTDDANVLTLDKLNALTSSNGCGNGTNGTAIIFKSGVYGFEGSSTPGSNSSNTWSINFPGSTPGSIFAGLPNWSVSGSSETPCGNSPISDGARFLFKNYSYLDVKRGKFIACATSVADPRGFRL